MFKWTAAAIGVLGAWAAQAQPPGQDWPNRTIRVISPYAPGGAADATARLAGQELQRILGQTVVVENRSGASGTIGGEVVRQAAPDGYTLLASPSSHILARHVLRAAPYDPQADFTPVARFAEGPMLVLVNPAMPAGTIAEALPLVRANPSRFTFGLGGLGAASHLAVLQFLRQAGVDLAMVAYRGSAPALTDLVSGNIQLMIDPGGFPLVQDGRLKALAITGSRRHPLLPGVPTAAESGMPGLEMVGWYGLWGPKDLPAPIVTRLNAAMAQAVQQPAVVQRLYALGLVPASSTPAALVQYIQEDLARSATLLQEAHYQPE
ncbi:Bug family tripartite tricarboxylate transporter substrate binding protein [Pararoseomonas indoligenes]|uniref:Tripartite tricarboxylate transporter substrate binding protein n=1 Tax=Roseomonas indoligenes TaxID=2820811 RepID=A0A940N0Z8_9PROT|nr:tripartite tricarboxylate transporter substrate binding protein [Pararoseomonas indoligenes]MBP0495891.1 tripartite tricarboxylate transporter substrate binding protein [Pararoseomonas indoligenes]